MHRAESPEEWSESCALTGLEIKQDQPAWIVVVDKDYAHGSGPCMYYGWRTPPVRGVYAGESALLIPGADVWAKQRYLLAWDCAGLRTAPVINQSTINSDQELLFIADSVFKHLGELPCQPSAEYPTIGQRVKARRKELFELLKECTTSEAAGREEDGARAQSLWENHEVYGANYEQWWGLPSIYSYLSNVDQLELLLDADHDSQLLFQAFDETRKVAVPVGNTGPALGGHQAVGALAAIVRRKAIHAGFAPA